MKKIFFYAAMTAFAVSVAGCSKDAEVSDIPAVGGKYTLASVSGSLDAEIGTRTGLGTNSVVNWSNKDRILVVNTSNGDKVQYELVSGQGTSVGKFEPLSGKGIAYTDVSDLRAVYPAVAAEVGVDEFFAEVLPEDKAAFIRSEKAAGRTVIMIGDGVNDSPALSEADAGVAISTGAAIAREIADITIASEDLFELVTLRRISEALMARIHRNYRTIVGFNLGLIIFGVAGILPPTTSALLHNASTLAISLKSMTNLLPAAAV